MTEEQLRTRVRILTLYCLLSSIVLAALIVSHVFPRSSGVGEPGMGPAANGRVAHLVVERLDVVEADGRLGISLSNSDRSPLPQFDGQPLRGASNRNIPNIIFFDGKGDEVGGIAFSNREDTAGGNAIRHLAFDGFKQDEVITLSHFEQDGEKRSGLYIYDRPEVNILDALNEMGVLPEDEPDALGEKVKIFRTEHPERYEQIWSHYRRVAVQTNPDEQAEIVLSDAKGNPRLLIAVSDDGDASIDFLREDGSVVRTLDTRSSDGS